MSDHISKSSAKDIERARRLQNSRTTHQASLIVSAGFETKKEREAFGVTLDASFERMQHASDQLEQSEIELIAEGADDPVKRRDRDDLASALYDRVRHVKAALSEGGGAQSLSQHGLRGRTPRPPNQLIDHTVAMIAVLEQPDLVVRDVLGEPLDLARYAQTLREPVGDLRGALDLVAQEEGERNAALIKRDTWRHKLNRYTGACEALYEALFLLADQEALWDREAASIKD